MMFSGVGWEADSSHPDGSLFRQGPTDGDPDYQVHRAMSSAEKNCWHANDDQQVLSPRRAVQKLEIHRCKRDSLCGTTDRDLMNRRWLRESADRSPDTWLLPSLL
jgi:hypothetical protein